MAIIRKNTPADENLIYALQKVIFPGRPLWLGSYTWVATKQGQLAGYITIAPSPGLPGVWDIDGGVHPTWQRQGLGRKLWLKAIQWSQERLTLRRLDASVPDRESPAAHFLQKLNFTFHHSEQNYYLPLEHLLPPAALPPAAAVQLETNPLVFQQWYQESFVGLPWFQPYENHELPQTMSHLYSLQMNQLPAGMAWFHLSNHLAQLEPFGLHPTYQKQGLARPFLIHTLHQLRSLGIQEVRLGVWHNNQPAIQLYQKIGFRPGHIRHFFELKTAST